MTILQANPTNISTQLAAAIKGGVDAIQLVGTFGHFGSGFAGAPPTRVTLDCTRAVLADNVLFNGQATNWDIVGGSWTGSAYSCLQLSGVHGITVRDAYFHNWSASGAAIAVAASTDIAIDNCRFAHSTSDAIDLAACQKIKVTNNKFWDMIYTATGLHTDCVQMWNIAGQPITSDIDITGNMAVVHCQCFGHYGDPTATAPVGNLRVNISNNAIASALTWAGLLAHAKDCTMEDNYALTTVGETKGWVPPSWVLTDGPEGTPDSGLSGNIWARNVNGLPPLG